jgi:hypothetical protein
MIELIQRRLEEYRVGNPVEEEQATKEILYEVALYVLWRAGFFEVAAFQGGTSLRILHGLPRFSEDLDFTLKTPDPDFDWNPYLEQLLRGLDEFGLKSEALDKSRMDQTIRKALIKDDSICNQLVFAFYRGREKKIKIKLEIDVNPLEGPEFEYSYLDFPLDFEVCHLDLSSNFSLIIHALLCRDYVKGRDWYDFNWYVKQKIRPNYAHLQAALNQYGPWKGQKVSVDRDWLAKALLEKVTSIDWEEAVEDVKRFLSGVEQESLKLWSVKFFSSKVESLVGIVFKH